MNFICLSILVVYGSKPNSVVLPRVLKMVGAFDCKGHVKRLPLVAPNVTNSVGGWTEGRSKRPATERRENSGKEEDR